MSDNRTRCSLTAYASWICNSFLIILWWTINCWLQSITSALQINWALYPLLKNFEVNLYYVKNMKSSKMFSSEIPGLWDIHLLQISMALMIFWKCEINTSSVSTNISRLLWLWNLNRNTIDSAVGSFVLCCLAVRSFRMMLNYYWNPCFHS